MNLTVKTMKVTPIFKNKDDSNIDDWIGLERKDHI